MAEGLGGKNYRWDKEDGYDVPEDRNLYNSYFYNAHDDTSVLDKFILHGHQTYQYTDGEFSPVLYLFVLSNGYK